MRKLKIPNTGCEKVYCGAFSLMAITGKNHEQACRAIRKANQFDSKKVIRGLYTFQLLKAFNQCGLKTVKPRLIEKQRWSFRQWIDNRLPEEKRQTFLVVLRGHFIIVNGNEMIDTFSGVPVKLDDAPHRRSRVLHYYRITCA